MIHFLSFADSNMAPTLSRIGKEAKSSGFFDKIWLFNEKTIDKRFMKERKAFFDEYKRGFGYWLWKPFLISYILKEKMQDGDILVYLDAGCEIHRSGKQRWEEYKEMLTHYSLLTYDHLHSFENQFTKYDVLDYFEVLSDPEIIESRQLWAGGLIMRKDAFVVRFINEWFNECDKNRTTLLCDAPSSHEELPTFKQHCHDQSFYSVICKKMMKDDSDRVKILPMIENYPYPHDWSSMEPYPFWAKRNKVFKRLSVYIKIKRRIQGLFNIQK